MTTRLQVVLSRRVQADMGALVQHPSFEERCGFVMGHRTPDGFRVEDIWPGWNALRCPDGFAIAPGEQRLAERRALRAGRECLGCFHSHWRGGLLRLSRLDEVFFSRSSVLWLLLAPDGHGGVDAAAFFPPSTVPLPLHWWSH